MAGLLVAGAIIAAVGAFTASNTVPPSKAGAGSGAISGYTVSSVHYTLGATDPTQIASVGFNLDTAPVAGSSIKIKLVSSGSTWYSCTNATTAVTCTTTGATVASADSLTVVVAD